MSSMWPIFIVVVLVMSVICPPFLGFVTAISAFFFVAWLLAKLMGA